MRTRNPSSIHAESLTRGHVGKRAGSPGITIVDERGTEVTTADVLVRGLTLTVDENDMAIITATGKGNAAGAVIRILAIRLFR